MFECGGEEHPISETLLSENQKNKVSHDYLIIRWKTTMRVGTCFKKGTSTHEVSGKSTFYYGYFGVGLLCFFGFH